MTDPITGAAGALVIMAIVIGGYFAPSLIAILRNHRQVGPIVVINLLLGWTLLGWVVALVWAVTAAGPPARQQ